MLQFFCPCCEKKFETDDGYAGGQVICDKCGFHFYVPELEDIEQVIVEYVDEKTQKKKFSIREFFSMQNKINLFLGCVILFFLLLAGAFLFFRNERIKKEQLHRAEILKLEQEMQKENAASVKRFISQIYTLKYQIEKSRYDRGQTFGQHLDNLKNEYSEAVELFKKQQYSECESTLEKAKESADWIIKNAPLREKAKKYLQKIADLMEKDRHNISAEKTDAARKAYHYYSNGNFEQALNELENNFFVNR